MWSEYFLFLMKSVTFLIVAGVLIGMMARLSKTGGGASGKGKLEITSLNKALDAVKNKMQHEVLNKHQVKKLHKDQKAAEKEKHKAEKHAEPASKCFSIRFKGDIQASQVTNLRQEITAILTVANPGDEVVVAIESPGGAVSGYGLAATQLTRLKDAGLTVTACVDKVAASGGYMMACVADKIIAAPFSIIGSIGVISQVPNIHRMLKRVDIDVDVITAGKHKAPLTLLGENTDEGREKHKQDLTAIHDRFKSLVKLHREQLEMSEVSEGDFWLASDALELQLVDEIGTSDSYLFNLTQNADVFRVQWVPHKSVEERIKGMSSALLTSFENFLSKIRLP
ncbi:protease SohB [Reinekea marinisedimentorum]|uniref:Serine protease SohB n=1 Tax=Reinekea marinisedimentorum TaxID=230495 RepID=A0A4R3IAU0_9GAMM|nr:protease SohB [Reinekea marinisedimentorum]TCS42619.1 serine protease SohB [Reinekea marinisedimentorum]